MGTVRFREVAWPSWGRRIDLLAKGPKDRPGRCNLKSGNTKKRGDSAGGTPAPPRSRFMVPLRAPNRTEGTPEPAQKIPPQPSPSPQGEGNPAFPRIARSCVVVLLFLSFATSTALAAAPKRVLL